MYERSAIVLERYFDNWLGLKNDCNIRDNFKNYCNIVEKLEKYQANYQKEVIATKAYNEVLRKIKEIQAEQKELYKRSAKLEYNRNLLFNNIDGKVEDTKVCIEKIEADVEKNIAAMKETKEKLLAVLVEYNEKRFELSKAKRYKKMAENDYNEILTVARKNYEGITLEDIETAKEFAKFTETENIIATLIENGSSEKIPFNEDVIRCTTVYSVELEKNEVAAYLEIYDKMTKLLEDIESGTTKINLHKKYVRNEKSKVDFILATKDYVIQFLDYERMTVIHGRKSHNRLMNEACENFNTDIVQINNLYELILRETLNKATKKAYKELYNKSYLIDIKEKEEKFKKEKNRVNLNTATLINSNYWRIEGIRNIYTVFYKSVSEVFGRDVVEFDIPKEFDEYVNEDDNQDVEVGDIIDNDVAAEANTNKTTKSEKEKKQEEKVEEKETAKIPFALDDLDMLSVDINFDSDDEFSKLDNDVKSDNKASSDDKVKKVLAEYNIDTSNDDSNEEDEGDNNTVNNNTNNVADDSEDDDSSDNTGNSLDEISERFKIDIDTLNDDNNVVEAASDDGEFDIFGDKYKEIDFSDNIDMIEAKAKHDISSSKNDRVFREISYDDGTNDDVEDLYPDIKKAKNIRGGDIETFSPTREAKKQGGLFGRLRRNNGRRAKRTSDDEEDIW